MHGIAGRNTGVGFFQYPVRMVRRDATDDLNEGAQGWRTLFSINASRSRPAQHAAPAAQGGPSLDPRLLPQPGTAPSARHREVPRACTTPRTPETSG